jgi:hypothetical protein
MNTKVKHTLLYQYSLEPFVDFAETPTVQYMYLSTAMVFGCNSWIQCYGTASGSVVPCCLLRAAA